MEFGFVGEELIQRLGDNEVEYRVTKPFHTLKLVGQQLFLPLIPRMYC